MAPRKPRKTDSRKYSSALYCSAWPNGEYAIVAGGGGKKTFGIPNRVIVISCKDDVAGEVVADLQTTDMPYRMVMSPDSKVLLVAMQPSGLLWVNVEQNGIVPKLIARTGDIAAKLKGLGSLKCVSFSADGRLVATGREDGHVHIYEFPSFMLRTSLWHEGSEPPVHIKQLEFSAAHGNKLLASVDEDGGCMLWHWEQRMQLLKLRVKDAGFAMGRFNRCCFGDVFDRRLYTTLNSGGKGFLVVWQQSLSGDIEFVRSLQVSHEPLAAFEVSPNGKFMAAGTTEGDVIVYDNALRRLVKRARQHSWVVTSLSWAQDSHAVMSVSGDSSALITPMRQNRRLGANLMSLLAVALVALLALAVKLLRDKQY